jgi:hypothetical protein
MNQEYLEDYEAKENEEFEAFSKKLLDGKFGSDDRFPQTNRFVKLQEPVAHCAGIQAHRMENIYAQIPFTGSLVLGLPPVPQASFERMVCKVNEIPKILEFVKDTGKLQVVLEASPTAYLGFDYLDPFIKELRPPYFVGAPLSLFGTALNEKKARAGFQALAEIHYAREFRALYYEHYPGTNDNALRNSFQKWEGTYAFLKLRGYRLADTIEDLMIDNPREAIHLLYVSGHALCEPAIDCCTQVTNYAFEDIQASQNLPGEYQAGGASIPFEIGKFLFQKLTYAPQTLRGCYQLLDTYGSYDLQKIQKSLNEAIVSTDPDMVTIKAAELSEILDNVWRDKTIQGRISKMKIVVPFSIAAVGDVASVLEATNHPFEGLLAALGFHVLSAVVDKAGDNFLENIAKFRAKSYQIDIFDFNKRHGAKIPKTIAENR